VVVNDTMRRVELMGGPRDGMTLTVASLSVLPETLYVVTGSKGSESRHAYHMRERGAGFFVYEYQGVASGTAA
jgi:hypothetical protein